MQKRIEQIAAISTGVYEKTNPAGDTIYLQGKHFDDTGRFRENNAVSPELQAGERLEKHLLHDGDILLIAKGEHNRACLYQSAIGRAVASSTFFVIRPTIGGLMPEYLQWYLNTAYMQGIFTALSKGTQIASLSKKALADIEIPLPPLQTQREILEVQRLLDKERSITSELIQLKDNMYQRLLLNLAKTTPAI